MNIIDRLDLRYRLHRNAEKLMVWFVWKLPRNLVYWSFIRVACQDGNAPHPETVRLMKAWEDHTTKPEGGEE